MRLSNFPDRPKTSFLNLFEYINIGLPGRALKAYVLFALLSINKGYMSNKMHVGTPVSVYIFLRNTCLFLIQFCFSLFKKVIFWTITITCRSTKASEY